MNLLKQLPVIPEPPAVGTLDYLDWERKFGPQYRALKKRQPPKVQTNAALPAKQSLGQSLLDILQGTSALSQQDYR